MAKGKVGHRVDCLPCFEDLRGMLPAGSDANGHCETPLPTGVALRKKPYRLAWTNLAELPADLLPRAANNRSLAAVVPCTVESVPACQPEELCFAPNLLGHAWPPHLNCSWCGGHSFCSHQAEKLLFNCSRRTFFWTLPMVFLGSASTK